MSELNLFVPKKGYIIVKDISKNNNTGPMKYSGEGESRGYGRVVASWDQFEGSSGFEKGATTSKWLGKMVVFNEFAGQELQKFKGIIDEDDLLIMSEEEIICIINEK